MNTLAKRYAEKLSLWPLVGPFMLLCSLTLLFFNFPEKGLTFACVVIFSLALCWLWTWRGVAISLGLLTAAFGYHAADMDSGELLWHAGMGVALSLGFVATALTAIEMQVEDESPSTEVQRAVAVEKETIKRLEEQLQTQREVFAQQRDEGIGLQQLLEAARAELKILLQEQEEDRRQLASRTQSAARAQEQMIEARQLAEEYKEQLISLKSQQDALQLTHEKEWEERAQELRKNLQSESEKWAQELRASRTQAEGQMKRAAFLEEEKQALRVQWGRELQEKQALQSQWERELQEKQALQSQRENAVEEKKSLEAHLALVQQNIAVAEAQKVAHWRALRNVEGKYQQLRQQFEEKTLSLAEARRERFEAQEHADKWKRELDELQLYGRLVEEKPLMKHLQRVEREYEGQLQACQKESEILHSLISQLFGN